MADKNKKYDNIIEAVDLDPGVEKAEAADEE